MGTKPLILLLSGMMLASCGSDDNAAVNGDGVSAAYREKCPIEASMRKAMPDPSDLGVPLPEDAVFWIGIAAGDITTNGVRYRTLPSAKYLTHLTTKEVGAFYAKRLGSEWTRGDILGNPVFYKATSDNRGKDALTVLMSRPGATPAIVPAPLDDRDECARMLNRNARTVIEIVYPNDTGG